MSGGSNFSCKGVGLFVLGLRDNIMNPARCANGLLIRQLYVLFIEVRTISEHSFVAFRKLLQPNSSKFFGAYLSSLRFRCSAEKICLQKYTFFLNLQRNPFYFYGELYSLLVKVNYCQIVFL